MTGFWLSITVTVNMQAEVLPAASAAVKPLVVTPTGKAVPLLRPAVWVVLAEQLSVVTTLYVCTLLHRS